MKIGNELLPLLLIEAGVFPAESAVAHKDIAKLSCVMSVACNRMALNLAANRRDPGQARCYGLLVGGTGAQLMVAHPVLDGHGWYIQVTSCEEWSIEVLSKTMAESINYQASTISNPATASSSFTQSYSDEPAFDETAPIAMSSLLEKIVSNQSKALFTGHPLRVTHSYDESFSLLLEEEDEEEEEEEDHAQQNEEGADDADPSSAAADTPTSDDDDQVNELSDTDSIYEEPSSPPKRPRLSNDSQARYGPRLRFSGLQRLYFFFEVVLEGKGLLDKLPSDWNESGDQPQPPSGSPPSIPSGVSSNSPNTSPFKQIASARSIDSNPPLNNYSAAENDQVEHFIVTKKYYYFIEAYIYQFITKIASRMFARTYSIQNDSATNTTRFEFERMDAMIDAKNRAAFNPSPKFFPHDASVYACTHSAVKFALDTLAGLACLHENLGFLHADISPSNIMYSNLDHCWKLNDFNLSINLCDAPSINWNAGTPGFKAPEVELEGRQSAASDVFSLGNVFSKVLLRTLPDAQLRHLPNIIKSARTTLGTLSEEMTAHDPQLRPTVKLALETILKLFKLLAPTHSDFIVRAAEEILRTKDICAPSATAPTACCDSATPSSAAPSSVDTENEPASKQNEPPGEKDRLDATGTATESGTISLVK